MDVIDAAHKTVHNPNHGGSTAIAARMGMSSTVLNNKVNPATNSHHLRLDEALTIMEYTNDTSIIQAMAQRLGGVFTLVESDTTQASIIMTALSTSACQGDVMSEMHKALEDGRIDCSEHDALQTKIQDTMKMLRTLAIQITQYCEGR
ncbi:regulatory cII-like protein [Psychrobacter phage Psymv2]|uniref:CII-like transcriptional activator n=1 Tax=Psychrobacter phage Psymv2 TaxID=1071177 RepID=UPI00022A379D|nr:CII-like transcriptional activator [Psychrobacter phage Psymv2]AEO00992.1 regulatory cII-like protein [Psychrobacter phage Psymv2]